MELFDTMAEQSSLRILNIGGNSLVSGLGPESLSTFFSLVLSSTTAFTLTPCSGGGQPCPRCQPAEGGEAGERLPQEAAARRPLRHPPALQGDQPHQGGAPLQQPGRGLIGIVVTNIYLK